MQKADTLIRTKLHLPLTRPELVSRPRLQQQIAQGLCGPLTLVTSPAGFGKTTLVASCVSRLETPVAWLSLEKNDNQPGRFLNYLVAALQEAEKTIGGEAAQMLAASQQVPSETILTSLINDLDSAHQDVILVLDDYQYINSQAVHEDVAFLLEHCPNSFHLVIASRSDPQLPLSKLRARGQTVELRAADLRFTETEAVQFLNEVMGLRLDPDSIALLENRTEGWIAGLQMAALSMRGREDVDGFIEAFAGTNRFIMDFMLEEVLAREPEEVQTFLLETAILSRLTGPLCEAVTGVPGGQAMLERLERRNLFVIALDDDRRWYRYHHLFADLLQARLYQQGVDRVAQLLSRAATWCEQDGQVSEAVSYAFAAQDYDRAAELIGKYWQPMAANGEIETICSWLNALPESIVKNSAPLSTAFCMVLWLNGQVGAIEAHLVDAERIVGDLSGSNTLQSDLADLPVVLAAMRSFVSRYHEDVDTAVVLAKRAIDLIPRDLPPQAELVMRSLAFLALGSAYDGAGDLEKAASAYAETIRGSRLTANATGVAGITFRMIGALRLLGRLNAANAACREALGYLQAQGMARLPAAGILHVAMSEVLVERNDLEAAQAELDLGTALGKWSGRLDAVKNAAYALSRLRQARHDPVGALAAIQDAETAMAELAAPLAMAALLAFRACILVQQGAVSEAAQCVETAARLAGRDRGQTQATVDLAACRVQLAQPKLDEAVAHISQSLSAAEASGRMGAAIELHILRSLALVKQAKNRDAELDLEKALTLAEPEGYARIFIDEGQPMRLLITQWLAHASASPSRGYALHLLAQFEPEAPVMAAAAVKGSPNGDLIEPLTPRELDVLSLLAGGLSNRQIAARLVLSEGTVKFYMHAIMEKLGVHSRTQAVYMARQQKLI